MKKGKGRFGKKSADKKESTKETKTKAKKATASNQPKYELSAELAEIVGASEMSRPDVTKKVWEYIKEHKLQDPKDKRMIVPDAKLAKVLGKKPVNMMQMAGLLGKHFKK